MKIENKVIGISILLGLLTGVADSAIDSLMFYEKSFWDLLIFDVPKFEIYLRSIILFVFAISGFIVSKIIVKHRKAEQIQNDFLNLVLDSLKHPFCVIDVVNYKIKLANSAAGLEQQAGNFTCHAIMHNNGTPCNSIEHPCPIEIIKKTKKPVTLEHLHYDKDGSPKNIEVHAHPILDSNGNVFQIIEYSTDITDRKRAEDVLRESHQIIEGIINAIPVRVFWKDKNLVYLGCNSLFAQDAGFADPKDIIGKDDYQMVWCDQAELYRNDDRQVIESGGAKLLIEEPQTTAEGKTITLLTSKIPLRSSTGEIVGVLGTYMDITQRKQAEETLREVEEMYRTLFESSRDAIMTLAPPTWFFTSGNPATTELFRVKDEAEFISFGPWQFSPERQPDGKPSDEKAKEMIEAAMRNGSHFFEWTHCHSDGTPFPAEVLLTRMEQRGQVSLQATVREITERKRIEEEREKLIHELQNALAEVKTLSGLLPICAHCKNVRDDKGYWNKIESYIHQHSGAQFSHGICPECAKKFFSEFNLYNDSE